MFSRHRRMVGAFAAALVFAGASLTGPVTQQAAADNPGITIELDNVASDFSQNGATLTITGSVTNTTNRALSGLSVTLWQSTSAIRTLAALDKALTAVDVTSPTGALVSSGVLPSEPLSTGDFGPRATSSFTLSGSISLPTPGAAYLIGVQVLDANNQVLARARLILGYPAGDAALSALVVPLTVRPSLIAPAVSGDTPSEAVFQNESLSADLSGELGQMLTLAEQPGITPLIDPELVDELTAQTGDYQVLGDDGQLTPGTGQEAAKLALDRIDALISRGGAYRLPYGDPDINALATVPDAVHLVTFTKIDSADPVAPLPLAILMKGQVVTPAAARLIVSMAPNMVISDAMDPSATLQTTGDSIHWVAATPVTTLEQINGPEPYFDGAATIQPQMARAARLAVAAGQGAPAVVLAGDGASAQLATTWVNEGWSPALLSQVIAGLTPTDLTWRSEASPMALPDGLTAKVTRIQEQLAVMTNLGDDPIGATTNGRRLIPAAVSATWQGDWASAATWLDLASAKLEQQLGTGGVEIHAAAVWYLSATTNRMPISVINSLGIPVTVKVRFTSDNPRLLNVPETDPVIIDPGATATVIGMPQAHANGTVQVSLQLYTMRGTKVGPPTQVEMVTTAAGRLGWIIIIGSGIAFVVATSLRVRQVRHSRKNSAVVSPTQTPADNAK